MRLHVHRKVAAVSAGVALLGVAPVARGQVQLDTNPPAPNVLILLDTSGSMERMIDGKLPEAEGQPCNYDINGKAIVGATAPTPNRWGSVIQALTGSWQNGIYNCIDMPRSPTGQFGKEYQIGGVPPYDTNYYLDYHRPVMLDPSTTPATACVVAPGALPGAMSGAGVGPNGAGSGGNGPGSGQSATDFPPDGVILRPFTQTTVAANAATGPCSQFASTQYQTYQYQDGAIPSSTALMRFGLMTFDQDPSPSIGVTSASPLKVTGASFVDPLSTFTGAFAGMWSYFPNWNVAGTMCPYAGNPVNCGNQTTMAIGARNPAAPPWEGRMIPFPVKDNTLKTQEQYNQWVTNVVLATRPYGATPLAGMLQDAEDYYWRDTNGPQQTDPLVFCGNRPQYIIILTDGAPNLDMRPDCEPTSGTPSGQCPFRRPEDIVGEMNAPPSGNQTPITTYVIGFAVSSANIDSQPALCSTLLQNGALDTRCDLPTPTGVTLDPAAQACCQLQRIALKGSQNTVRKGVVSPNMKPTSAFFADTPGALQNALKDILANIASNATTRTTPAFASSSSNFYSSTSMTTSSTQVVGAEYLASFNPSPGLPLAGDLIRSRQVCGQSTSGYGVTTANYDPTAGDDFGSNLNSNSSIPRTFIGILPATRSDGTVDATTNIRPYVTTDRDGFGNYSATTLRGDATFVSNSLTAAALGISQPCPYNATVTDIPQPPLQPPACAAMTLAYTFGQSSFVGEPGNYPFISRAGRAFGGIYHASPAIVGAPNTLLQDPGYSSFQTTFQGREPLAYVATTDGLLHAFWTEETTLENNERWAMLLPAVMPKLNRSIATPTLLLDGTPVVKDVAWDRNLTSASTGDGTIWHSMLVASYGPNNAGYYAVDVSDPKAADLQPNSLPLDSPVSAGPHFRWQLTTVPSTNYKIFGAHSATPAITTLFVNPGDGSGAREVAVAILPGGSDGSPTSSASSGPPCARAPKNNIDSQPLGAYQYRANVQCWGATQKWTDAVNGRSVAVVRVDTGEILQVFERKTDAQTGTADTLLAKGRVNDTPLDSPMTGTPVVYPGDVGTDATKVFISDADGTIWKFDLSDPTPSNWKGTLFLDLYNQSVDTNATAWADGQPLTVTPTLSTDTNGNVVLNAATGVTDTFDSNGIEFLYSITEKVQGTSSANQQLRAFVNWYMGTPLTPPANSSTVPYSEDTASNTPAPFMPGERVSGPMVVFDGKLYFATYDVPPPPTMPGLACNGNVARVWGVDYVMPSSEKNCSSPNVAESCGGVPSLPPQAAGKLDYAPFAKSTLNALATAVIPGVTINATPACAGLGTSTNDQYVGGAQHFSPQGLNNGSFQLTGQAGAPVGIGIGTSSFGLTVPTPLSPTVIDSWAAVLE